MLGGFVALSTTVAVAISGVTDSPQPRGESHPLLSAPAETVVGILAFSDEQPGLANQIVSFPIEGDGTPYYTSMVGFPTTSTAGAYADGAYYVSATRMDGTHEVADALYKVDLEKGSYSKVGNLAGYTFIINDMSYDITSKKMYAVSRLDNNVSDLYTIDLATAESNKVSTLDRRFFTLACNRTGQLYGVSFEGDFCKIDKSDGKVEVVGETGFHPNKFQSMEFDHERGILHWACIATRVSESGTMEFTESFMATIDPTTGLATKGRTLGEDQIAGLYIPHRLVADGAPQEVSDFTVTPAANGVYSATLSWTNPAESFSGEPLKVLNKVVVLRDGVEVTNITNPAPGEKSTFIDRIADAGGDTHTYTVLAYNAAGEGLAVSETLFVGTDIPAKPESVKLERLGANSAKISWEPVVKGAHGGWLDLSSIAYNVTRKPDNFALASGITDTEVTETGVEEPGSFSYEVTAVNKDGSSEASVTETIALGPKTEFPLTEEFSEESFGKWTVKDANEDENSWNYYNLSWAKAQGAYFMAATYPGDDWLISLPFDFDGSSTYKISLTYIANGNHTVDVKLLNDFNTESAAVDAGSFEFARGFSLATKEITFNVENAGEYNLAFHELAEAGNSYLLIDRMVVEKVVDHNLAITDFTGNSTPNIGNTYTYSVKVINRGGLDCESFGVELLDQDGRRVAITENAGPLAPGEETYVAVSYVASENVSSLTAHLVWGDDEIANDDSSEPLVLNPQPAGTPEGINIGVKQSTTREHPFSFYRKHSAAYEIYQASEFGIERGRIFEVRYPYTQSSYGNAPENVSVKLYLANTDLTDTNAGWMPLDEMTLVYEGQISLEKGDNVLSLPLINAFEYTGKNLAVVALSDLDPNGPTYYSGSPWHYYKSPNADNVAYVVETDNTLEYGVTAGKKSYYGNTVVTFMVQTGGASVSGAVKDTEGIALENAEVRIEPAHATTYTDAEGRYAVDFLPNGDYVMSVKKKYYADAESYSFTVADGDVAHDFTMTKLPQATLSGRVTDNSGNPLEGVKVALEGYETLTATTTADGSFTLSNVVCQPSNVTLTRDWYAPLSMETELFADTNLGNLAMNYAHYPVGNVVAVATGSDAEINWTAPDAPVTLKFDAGEPASQFGITDNIGTAVIGTAFRASGVYDKFSWLTTEEGGPHDKVNLYVYALDVEGLPTGNLLLSVRNVASVDGEWTEYVPEAPISAPYGCLVTLNYPGFLGLATDEAPREYPFETGRYYYSVDYSSGEFALCENIGLDANLLIRANAKLYPAENTPLANVGETRESLPEWMAYNVYRASGYNPSADAWTLLSESALSTNQFADPNFSTLKPGVYSYAVTCVYPDGTESEKTTSAYMLNRTFSNLTVNVATNSHSGDAAGALVTLVDLQGEEVATATVNEGKVQFDEIWKDDYTVRITLDGYEDASCEADLTLEDDVEIATVTLKEIIAKPVNMRIASQSDTQLTLTWNESGEISDDFEDYEDFAAPSRLDMRWKCLDMDGARTFAEQSFDFPGRTNEMSFITFNPQKTTPSMYDERSASHPYSGVSQLACFGTLHGNDDWLISPALTYHTDYKVSFYARGYSATYIETIQVGYSMTDDNPSNFVWVGEPVDVAKQVWTKYEFEIPAAARHFAIRCISADGFTLFIDDLTISSGLGFEANTIPSGPEFEYDIYLDGEKIATTKEPRYVLTRPDSYYHTLSVKTTYASGESDEESVSFGEGGIDEIGAGDLNLNGNGAVINGNFKEARLYDVSGKTLRVLKPAGENTTVTTSGLNCGVYMLVIDYGTTSRTVKLTVK